jgi:chaperone modulatory protein CbpM
MTRTVVTVHARVDECWLGLDDLCRLAGVTPQWVRLHVDEGLLGAAGEGPQAWRFDAAALARVRRLCVVEHAFDAAPELAALVADLEDEIASLRARLRRAGLA